MAAAEDLFQANGGFHASAYHAPQILISLGSMLRVPRQAYTTSFSDTFSDSLETQREYGRGLVAIGTFFLCCLVVWGFILIVLKLKGREVGCASGRAFHLVKADPDEDLQVTDSSSSSSGEYSVGDADRSVEGLRRYPEEEGGHEVVLSDYGDGYDGDESDGSWTLEDEHQQSHRQSKKHDNFSKMKEHPRERKTRLTFLFFSFISLIMVPFILVFSFGPIKEATEGSKQMVLQANEVMDSIASSFNDLESAGRSSQDILKNMPTNLKLVCPLINQSDMEFELGIDLGILQGIVVNDIERTSKNVAQRLAFYDNSIGRIQNATISFEHHVEDLESWMWIVPGLLFTVSILAAICILGAILAWKRKSGDRIQMSMSYILLPILILVSIGCWAVVVMASFGTILTSDMCTTSGMDTGSPENTIYEILAQRHRSPDDPIYQLVQVYTDGCHGIDPTFPITSLEKEVQENVNNIWRQVSIIDSIGRAKLLDQCGGDNLVDFITGSRDVAKLLTSVRRSLRSASGQLECNRLNPMYTETVHENLCTDAALASSYGFIMFLILAISTMIMISLRASWLQSIGEEEKVYQDEDEIAENMVLNEHEEYLSYISRYKHEWQEYNGFDNRNRRSNSAMTAAITSHDLAFGEILSERSYDEEHSDSGRSYGEHSSMGSIEEHDSAGSVYVEKTEDEASRTDGEGGYNGSDESYSVSGVNNFSRGLKVDILPTLTKPQTSDDEDFKDDISFPSLKDKSDDDGTFEGDRAFDPPSKSLLNPPAANPNYSMSVDEIVVMDTSRQASAPVEETVFEARQRTIEPEGRDASTVTKQDAPGANISAIFNNIFDAGANNLTFSDTEKESDVESNGRGTWNIEDFGKAVLPSTPESQDFEDIWM